LPLTMRSFTRTLNLAMETFMGWEDGKPNTPESQWIWRRAREALRGEAYLPPRGPKVWKWRLPDGTIHDLEMVSSGQMEAWPLVLASMCLLEWRIKGLAAKNAVIYVEEPEVHLHPSAQLEILHILAYLVNQGIHVVFTTHSPLLLFLLNALLRYSDVGDKNFASGFEKKLFLPPEECRLQPEQVAVYELTYEGANSLMTEDGEVDEDHLREAEWTVYKYFNSIQAALETLGEVG